MRAARGFFIQVYSNPSHNRPSIAVPAIQVYSKFSISTSEGRYANHSLLPTL